MRPNQPVDGMLIPVRCLPEKLTGDRCSISASAMFLRTPKAWIFEPKTQAPPSESGTSPSDFNSCSSSSSEGSSLVQSRKSSSSSPKPKPNTDEGLSEEPAKPTPALIPLKPYKSAHEYNALCCWNYLLVNYMAPRFSFVGNTRKFGLW